MRAYVINEPEGGWRTVSSFTDQERQILRPIAETIAMLDGNAFFGVDYPDDHWVWYLPEAAALFEANGGIDGWAGNASFAKTWRRTKNA